MEQTVSVTLSGLNFFLEKEAYNTLDQYLTEIKSYFEENIDKEEIIKDIENSIAQKLCDLQNPQKQVITLAEIQGIIRSLGSIKDFEENDVEEKKSTIKLHPKKETTPIRKKLFRDPDRKIIAGVCSGIAAYVGCD